MQRVITHVTTENSSKRRPFVAEAYSLTVAHDGSYVIAERYATVTAKSGATVVAEDDSIIKALDGSTVFAHKWALVYLSEDSSVAAQDGAVLIQLSSRKTPSDPTNDSTSGPEGKTGGDTLRAPLSDPDRHLEQAGR